MKIYTTIFCLWVLAFPNIYSQEQTVGLFINEEDAYDGYTLFAPLMSANTYLIDNNGELVHSWESDSRPGLGVYLLEDGSLLRTQSVSNPTLNAGGSGGHVVKLDWDGNKTWEYYYSDDTLQLHHDIEPLPDGNILMIAWVSKSTEEATNAGRNPDLVFDEAVWSLRILEIEPQGEDSGNIVWEWNAWDHLVQDYDSSKPNYGTIEDHPELIDLNYIEYPNSPGNSSDWLHTNGIDYNNSLDQILLSIHNFNEIWIIDHSTTTQEAAGHTGGTYTKGGDLLYRWGNPAVYGRGSSADKKLYSQHDAEWIPSGYPGENNITIFSNGDSRNRSYSTVEEITPPYDTDSSYIISSVEAYGPDETTWTFMNGTPEDFFATNISGAQRLENGNTLICSGPYGDFFEVTTEKDTVWRYVNPVTGDGPLTQGDTIPTGSQGQENLCFRAVRYSLDYDAFEGRDLTPQGVIELGTTSVNDNETLPEQFTLYQNYPNPFNPATTIEFSIPESAHVTLKIYNALGEEVRTLIEQNMPAGNQAVTFNAGNLASGIYFYKITTDDFFAVKKMLLLK